MSRHESSPYHKQRLAEWIARQRMLANEDEEDANDNDDDNVDYQEPLSSDDISMASRGTGPDSDFEVSSDDGDDSYASSHYEDDEDQPEDFVPFTEELSMDEEHWYPYESKLMFLLCALDSSPNQKLSDEQLKLVIATLRASNVQGVPSFSKLRRFQKKLGDTCSLQPKEEDIHGDKLFLNDPRDIIARDWQTPSTRQHINLYPEVDPEEYAEIWHAGRLQSLDASMLPPMWEAPCGKQYFVEEIAVASNRFVIPRRWLYIRGHLHFEATLVIIDENRVASIADGENCYLPVSTLQYAITDINPADCIQWASRELDHFSITHPDRQEGSEPIYVSFVELFCDDVSGNRSKSWNKHLNHYMSHRNLPRSLVSRQFHVHLVSTSQTVTMTEQFGCAKRYIEATEAEPIRVYDSATNRTIRLRLVLLMIVADNPMASELANHIGPRSNKFCRKCDAGGTMEAKSSDEGYAALFRPGTCT